MSVATLSPRLASPMLAGGPRFNRVPAAANQRLSLRVGRQTIYVNMGEIRWVQAARNYLRLYTGEDYHLLRETMNSLESRLDPKLFIRIHRCTIVNRNCVVEVRHHDNGQSLVVLDDQTVLRMSRGYRHVLGQFSTLAPSATAKLPCNW